MIVQALEDALLELVERAQHAHSFADVGCSYFNTPDTMESVRREVQARLRDMIQKASALAGELDAPLEMEPEQVEDLGGLDLP